MNEDHWLNFIQQRLNELHPYIWSEKEPLPKHSYPYFTYNRILNKTYNKGTDYSGNPRNPLTEN